MVPCRVPLIKSFLGMKCRLRQTVQRSAISSQVSASWLSAGSLLNCYTHSLICWIWNRTMAALPLLLDSTSLCAHALRFEMPVGLLPAIAHATLGTCGIKAYVYKECKSGYCVSSSARMPCQGNWARTTLFELGVWTLPKSYFNVPTSSCGSGPRPHRKS